MIDATFLELMQRGLYASRELIALRIVAGAFICTTIIATVLWLRTRSQLRRKDYGRTKL